MNNASTTCNRCGKSVPSESRFCLECGSDLTGISGGSGSTPAEQVATRIDKRANEQALFETLRHATLGEYDVIAEVGRGGMANVYLAHDIALDRKVAIKVISPELLRMGEGVVERFQREARTAASLSHPHIIPIYSVKESDRILFFVMKFVEGRTLESVVREEGQLPVAMVQTILNQVGSALDYAHRRGVIHRDIKPGNIMLDEGGWAVVTDFGIAKVTQADGLTMTGATLGTPAYMSPEQCAGQPLTGAVDQYALGVVAYEMLAGRLPFEGDSAMTVMYKHTHEPPPPIHVTWPECPRPLGNAVMRMLAKDPDDRFPSMQAAVEAIGMAERDDTVRTHMVSLAKSGGNQALLAQFQTPKSSIPRPGAFKTRGTPTNVSTPIVEDSGAQPMGGVSTTAAPSRSKSKLIWSIPAVVVLGGIAWVVFSTGGSQTGADQPADFNVPSVNVSSNTIAELTVGPSQVNLQPGDQQKLTPVVTDSSGASLPDAEVTFSSRDTRIADVSADGTVAAVAAGNTVVTARAGTYRFAIPVTVTDPPQSTPVRNTRPAPTVASVEISPDNVPTARVGDTIRLRSVARDGRGNQMAGQSASWRSSDNNVVSVDRTGVARAVGEGTARIIAQVGAYADTTNVDVQPVAVNNVTLSPAQNTLNVGEALTLTAQLTDMDGNVLNRTVAWSSSDPTVARVDNSGRVSAVSAGTATITASVDGQRSTARVSVRAAEATPPEPPRPDPAADRQAIEDVVEQYRTAIQREDISALRSVFPGMPASREQSLRSFFNLAENLRVGADLGDISLQGDEATVEVVFRYDFRISGGNESDDDPQRLSLRRESGRWIISDIR